MGLRGPWQSLHVSGLGGRKWKREAAARGTQVIMEREHSNPEFGFLFDVRCPEHAYYRWRLFSLANGDSLRRWGAAVRRRAGVG